MTISNADYLIDVRDVIASVESLTADDADQALSEEDKLYLIELEKLLMELKGNGGDEQYEGDWYPLTLIRDDYFEEAMDDMVADCYVLPKDLPSWMTITYDYDALKQDYSSVEFDGATYWYR